MKKINQTLALLLLLTPCVTVAQNAIAVQYNLSIQINTTNPTVEKITSRGSEGAEQVLFTLYAHPTEALFTVDKSVVKRNHNTDIALLIAGYFNPIYSNQETKIMQYNNTNLHQIESDKYRIQIPIFTEWKLETETKKIQNLVCYKATGVVAHDQVLQNVIAWYCPEIPFPHGPLGYGGLPGLILELQRKDVLLGTESINFNPNLQHIESPEKGIPISEVDFINLIKIN